MNYFEYMVNTRVQLSASPLKFDKVNTRYSMIVTLATSFVLFTSLFLSLKYITELFNDARDVAMLCSANVNVSRAIHHNYKIIDLALIALNWAVFWLLCCL